MRRLAITLALWLVSAAALAQDVTFATVDVFLDSENPVAAWQFELDDRNGVMQVVGVEQGEASAFTRVPYYDLDAVQRGDADRIIVADYTLADVNQLPSGRFRLATIHVMLRGDDADLNLNLVTATTYDGERTDARASFAVRQGSEQ